MKSNFDCEKNKLIDHSFLYKNIKLRLKHRQFIHQTCYDDSALRT